MVMNPEEEDWLKQLERRIDWKAEKKRVEEELNNLDKLATYLIRERACQKNG